MPLLYYIAYGSTGNPQPPPDYLSKQSELVGGSDYSVEKVKSTGMVTRWFSVTGCESLDRGMLVISQ